MSEKDMMIKEVHKRTKENVKLLNLNKTNFDINNANILNFQKQLKQLKIEYDLRKSALEKKLNRAVDNLKFYQSEIDRLIENKEVIHNDLKKAIHIGEKQCPYCNRYFSPQGYPRHIEACSAKPEVKIVKEQKKDIDNEAKEREARLKKLEMLKKQVADLEKG